MLNVREMLYITTTAGYRIGNLIVRREQSDLKQRET